MLDVSGTALQMITTGRETGGQPESEATEDDRVAHLFEHLKAQRPPLCQLAPHDDISPDQNAFKSHHQSWEEREESGMGSCVDPPSIEADDRRIPNHP